MNAAGEGDPTGPPSDVAAPETMRLLYTPIRNYTHTVEAMIAYSGVADRIEPVATRPFDPQTRIAEENPLGTVPTLITGEGEALYGGPVIYEYFDSLHTRPRLYPQQGVARWTALRQAWMADGMFDATVRLIVEGMEPAGTYRPGFIDRCWQKVIRCLDQTRNRRRRLWHADYWPGARHWRPVVPRSQNAGAWRETPGTRS